MNDKTKAVELDDFEGPQQHPVTIKIGDVSRDYIVCEVSSLIFLTMTAQLNAKDDDVREKAQREAQAKIISQCVKRADGSAITFEQASGFRAALSKQLEKKVLELNGVDMGAAASAKKE